jgi:hypothetical protein
MDIPAASMLPSITSRNASGSSRNDKTLGDEGARHQRRAGDQTLQREGSLTTEEDENLDN